MLVLLVFSFNAGSAVSSVIVSTTRFFFPPRLLLLLFGYTLSACSSDSAVDATRSCGSEAIFRGTDFREGPLEGC